MPIHTQGQPPPNIQTLRTQKTSDTQVDVAPPPPTDPPTDPPPRQQNALLEGESTCNEMVPARKFRRPSSPPMPRRLQARAGQPAHILNNAPQDEAKGAPLPLGDEVN
ncbi:hypothetical protein CRENBAI_021344 [Crenichthys baileyi]|uniref:Uncharacterized protein n=1 Tax=Crenichthys baileyi TaxID=28760 RepID=A0AAV9QPN0_9TELE